MGPYSFYGMQALLLLYMTEWLLRPGHATGVLGLSELRRAIEAVTGALSTGLVGYPWVGFLFAMGSVR